MSVSPFGFEIDLDRAAENDQAKLLAAYSILKTAIGALRELGTLNRQVARINDPEELAECLEDLARPSPRDILRAVAGAKHEDDSPNLGGLFR